MATVMNPGDPGRGVDRGITPKNLMYPFQANNELAVIITTGPTPTSTRLPKSPTRGRDDCVRMINPNAFPVRVKFSSDGTVQATPTDKAIAPGATEIFRLTPGRDFVSTYSAQAGTLECNMGAGM